MASNSGIDSFLNFEESNRIIINIKFLDLKNKNSGILTLTDDSPLRKVYILFPFTYTYGHGFGNQLSCTLKSQKNTFISS